jgi:uncharacterized membrane protein
VSGEAADQTWRGLAALCGSWIGGGANMTAIQRSVGADANIMGAIVVVDVVIANVWMIFLLYFADREKAMDARIGADRATVEAVRRKVEDYQAAVKRPTDLGSLMVMLALAFGATWVASGLAGWLPPIGSIIREFAWKVILVTVIGVSLSFTKVRSLEGAGASAVGSVLLYLLVASIGAKADFARVVDPQNLPLVAVGALWMAIHVVVILATRNRLRAPIFFAAVGSKANIGGAASAPIVAHAFHPALAPAGVLLAVGGYVLGTVVGLGSAKLFELVNELYHG